MIFAVFVMKLKEDCRVQCMLYSSCLVSFHQIILSLSCFTTHYQTCCCFIILFKYID